MVLGLTKLIEPEAALVVSLALHQEFEFSGLRLRTVGDNVVLKPLPFPLAVESAIPVMDLARSADRLQCQECQVIERQAAFQEAPTPLLA